MKKIIIWIVVFLWICVSIYVYWIKYDSWMDEWSYCEYKTLPCKKWLECIDSNSGLVTESEWLCKIITN